MYSIGTRVRVISPPGSVFYGHTGIIVEPRKTRRGALAENAVQFPDHPWQLKVPSSVWYFSDQELEPATGSYRVGYLRDPRPADPRVATLEEALNVACAIDDDNAVLAVWDDQDAIVCILYQGRAFWP